MPPIPIPNQNPWGSWHGREMENGSEFITGWCAAQGYHSQTQLFPAACVMPIPYKALHFDHLCCESVFSPTMKH